ncbi:hypothetical protein BDR05DRAFT_516220 [Suillus weaverae]|nr:hypothetical protein BDR05DRAFT_516220 [Suillus weaverae]
MPQASHHVCKQFHTHALVRLPPEVSSKLLLTTSGHLITHGHLGGVYVVHVEPWSSRKASADLARCFSLICNFGLVSGSCEPVYNLCSYMWTHDMDEWAFPPLQAAQSITRTTTTMSMQFYNYSSNGTPDSTPPASGTGDSVDETFLCMRGMNCNALIHGYNLSAHLHEAHEIHGRDKTHVRHVLEIHMARVYPCECGNR